MNNFRKPFYNINEEARYYKDDGSYDLVRVAACEFFSKSYVYIIEWNDGSEISVLESSLKKHYKKAIDDELFGK